MGVLVRFLRDSTIYAAGDEATFGEEVASRLVQTGQARIVPVEQPVAPVAPAKQQLELQPLVADNRKK